MFDETVCDVLGTFDMIAEIPEESLGACTLIPLPLPCALCQSADARPRLVWQT